MNTLPNISESVKDQNETSKARGEMYGKIREDMTISHGAFRLWHILNGMAGQRGHCWPGQRYLAEKYPFSIHSLRSWIQQLVSGGYLRLEKPNRNTFPNV